MDPALADFELQEEIGHGSFATVYKALQKSTQRIVAIKSIKTSKLNNRLIEALDSEISILSSLKSHENIVKLYDTIRTESTIYLIMEYCNSGDLSGLFRRVKLLPEDEIKNLVQQIARALEALRLKCLVHRDLKPQNLLLHQDFSIKDNSMSSFEESKRRYILKVGDFGFARKVEVADLAETLCGSPLYMAPEILKYEKYDASKADLWSLGAIMYEMFCGRPPFRASNHISLLKKIEASPPQISFPTSLTIQQPAATEAALLAEIGVPVSSKSFLPDNPNISIIKVDIKISEPAKDLISWLLRKDPKERIDFEEFFWHPWLDFEESTTSLMKVSSNLISLKPAAEEEEAQPQQELQSKQSESQPQSLSFKSSFGIRNLLLGESTSHESMTFKLLCGSYFRVYPRISNGSFLDKTSPKLTLINDFLYPFLLDLAEYEALNLKTLQTSLLTLLRLAEILEETKSEEKYNFNEEQSQKFVDGVKYIIERAKVYKNLLPIVSSKHEHNTDIPLNYRKKPLFQRMVSFANNMARNAAIDEMTKNFSTAREKIAKAGSLFYHVYFSDLDIEYICNKTPKRSRLDALIKIKLEKLALRYEALCNKHI